MGPRKADVERDCGYRRQHSEALFTPDFGIAVAG